LEAKCVQPDAPWVECCVCGKKIKTCTRKEPIEYSCGHDYTCPAHPEGNQLCDQKKWVCSDECWEVAVGPVSREFFRIIEHFIYLIRLKRLFLTVKYLHKNGWKAWTKNFAD